MARASVSRMKTGVSSRGSPMLKLMTGSPDGASASRWRSSRTKGYSIGPVSTGLSGPGREFAATARTS